ncbi:MAG TPA: cupin domain-containing protein [Vineibacter sp.]|nr:cupin domain-containing protein [Vineibacter sp.]
MDNAHTPVVGRLEESEPVSFGPLSIYQKLVGGGQVPIWTGVQTCRPGYAAPLHSHPYMELILVLEGEGAFWFGDDADNQIRLKQHDIIALPPRRPHAFRNAGEGVLKIMGIHCSPERHVDFVDGRRAGPNGYQVFDAAGQPMYDANRSAAGT